MSSINALMQFELLCMVKLPSNAFALGGDFTQIPLIEAGTSQMTP